MQFTIPRASLLAALRLAAGVADRKSTMPMLSNVLLRVTKRTLLVAATDLNVSLSAEVELAAKPSPADGGMTIAAKSLYDIVATAPGDAISVKRLDNGHAEVVSGKTKYRVVAAADREFPKLPDHREVAVTTVDASRIMQLIDRTLFSVCQDETRFHLCGVYLTGDGKTVTAVSTDGHRLSVATSPLELQLPSAGIIVGRKGLIAVRDMLKLPSVESCSLAVANGHLFVRVEATTLAVKLVDGQSPPWQQVMPKSKRATITVNRQSLIDCIRRMQSMTTDTRGMKLTLVDDETLTVRADNPDLGEVEESIIVDSDGELAESFGANPKYFSELLSAIDSDFVCVECDGPLDPVLVRASTDDGYRGVVMPMRVS